MRIAAFFESKSTGLCVKVSHPVKIHAHLQQYHFCISLLEASQSTSMLMSHTLPYMPTSALSFCRISLAVGRAGLEVLEAVVEEFNLGSASPLGLPWDFHERCCRDMEVRCSLH